MSVSKIVSYSIWIVRKYAHICIGLQNWLAIRSEWREYPEDFDPSKIVRVDPTNLDKNQIYNVISGQQPYRMPLSTLISALTLVWDELMN